MPASKARQVVETGTEPEFVVNHIVRWENAGNGMVRLYLASVRGPGDRLEFAAVTSPSELADMARAALKIAAEFHNLLTIEQREEVTTAH